MISKSCKYAIRAIVFVASKAGTSAKPGVKEIAEEIEAPSAFTAKILRILSKHKLVTSLKGPYGGFFCEKHQLELPLIDIVNAIDGIAVFKECVMGLHNCSDAHPCPMHDQYAEHRNNLLNSFQSTSIGNLARNFSSGNTYLKN
jgi:Rrf2 family protein